MNGQRNSTGRWKRLSEYKWHTRLKRVYEVRLQHPGGRVEARFVLAKSVGWGWLSYRAFLLADRLANHVTVGLGLRNGILYTEFYPQDRNVGCDRESALTAIGSYVAARTRAAALAADPSVEIAAEDQHMAYDELASMLSRAYGWKPAAVLKRPRLRRQLSRQTCPLPMLTDGKMRPVEWILGPSGLRKSDFEHHGMGKRELNMTDPAYDLADAILHWNLSASEEERLISLYREQSGDRDVASRLYLNKLLAGQQARNHAIDCLRDVRLSGRHGDYNRQYLEAVKFLIVHSARLAGKSCRKPATPHWHAPLVVMDIDGVLDRQAFGFPSTTAAGIEAVSLFHSHGFCAAVDSARSIAEVKEYCVAYGLAGGVAEYGAYAWDAVGNREKVLVDAESLAQLQELRRFWSEVPGIFFNDDYRYSLRAYTFRNGATVALPTPMVLGAMAKLGLDKLTYHQTELDTAILAKGIDKGAGLLALLGFAGVGASDCCAIGDSEPDLAMFRAAGRAFAPSHISCRSEARAVGCKIASKPVQPGLLEIARKIVHPNGGQCDRCHVEPVANIDTPPIVGKLLKIADEGQARRLLRAMLDPMLLEVFAT